MVNFIRLISILLFVGLVMLGCKNNSVHKITGLDVQLIEAAKYSQADFDYLNDAIASGEDEVRITAYTENVREVVGKLENNRFVSSIFSRERFNYVSFSTTPEEAISIPTEVSLMAIGVGRKYSVDPIEKSRINFLENDLPPVNMSPGQGSTQFPFLPTNEIKAVDFVKKTGIDGKNVKIAIVDTGVFVGHPALSKTSDGKPKIIDWKDFTKDGELYIKEVEAPKEGKIKTKYSEMDVGDLKSDDGKYFSGALEEKRFMFAPPDELADVNLDGDKDDVFEVVIVKQNKKFVGYIDVNQNKSIKDDKGLVNFKDSLEYISLDKKKLSNVVFIANTDDKGNLVGAALGYDGHLHGTHTAGIASGNGFLNGRLNGVAPGAQVLAIKVLGILQPADSVERGIIYAAEQGADVINMSLGSLPPVNDGNSPEAMLVNNLAKDFNIVFSISAGNEGPGLNTIGDPAASSQAITVGAYISSQTFASNYSIITSADDLLWYFSSVGPRLDGALKPDIVAPGSALSSVPLWVGGHYATQGTSMAAPMVTGASALLVSAAKAKKLDVKQADIKKSLIYSARKLSGYSVIEQGSGLIDVVKAYSELQNIAKTQRPFEHKVLTRSYILDSGIGTGGYTRGFLPKAELFQIQKVFPPNTPANEINATLSQYEVKTDADWITVPASFYLTGDKPNKMVVNYNLTKKAPGIYSTKIVADDPTTYGADFELVTTAIVPYQFDENYRFKIEENIEPGKVNRYMIKVPIKTDLMKLSLTMMDENVGKAFLVVTSPHGDPSGDTSWATPGKPQSLSVKSPFVGVWEVDVFANPGAGSTAKFKLEINLSSVSSDKEEITFRNVVLAQAYSQNFWLTNLNDSFESMETAFIEGYQTDETITVSHQQELLKDLVIKNAVPKVSVITTNSSDKNADIDIEILNSEGVVVADSKTGGSEEKAIIEMPDATTYKVKIMGYSVPNNYSHTTDLTYIVRYTLPDIIPVLTNEEKAIRKPLETWQAGVSFVILDAVEPPFYYIGEYDLLNSEKELVLKIPLRVYLK